MKKRSAKLKWIGLGIAGLSAVLSGSALAHSDLTVESKGGLKVFNPADSSYWFAVGGRLNLDEAIYSGSTGDKANNFASGGNIRRSLLKFHGGLGEDFSYAVSLNFDGTNVGFNDAWLGAAKAFSGMVDKAWVRIGQFTPPTSIDDAPNYGTSDNAVFMESALATSAFSTPTQVYGVQASASLVESAVLSAAVYQPAKSTAGNANFGNNTRSDRVGSSVRLTFVPVRGEDAVLHLGAIGRYQSVNKTDAAGANTQQASLFWTAPELQSRQVNGSNANLNRLLLNTGAQFRAKSYNVVTGEALGIWGPASVQGEYYSTSVQQLPMATTTTKNLRFNGYHLQVAYVLTGESRGYCFTNGVLHNPKPTQKYGAWELAARYSFVNLNDRNVYGGAEHNTTLGLNWFANDNIHLAANYIRANIRPNTGATNPKRQLDIFGLRVGLSF